MKFLIDVQDLHKLPDINVAFDIEGELVTAVWLKKNRDGTVSIIHNDRIPCGNL